MLKMLRVAAAVVAFTARLGMAQVASGGNPAVTPVPRAEPWWVARHQDKIAEAQRGSVDLLFVGDSITQNYEKPGPAPDEVFQPAWTEFFAAHRPMNLGFSGDQTQHVLWRLQHGEVDGISPKNIVLLIGTNNTGRGQSATQVTAGVQAVIAEMRMLMPKAHVLVIDILPSSITAEKSDADARINAAIRARYAGSPMVRTLDLSGLFLRDGMLDAGLFYDPGLTPPKRPLHPNTVGQRKMAQAVATALFGGSPSH